MPNPRLRWILLLCLPALLGGCAHRFLYKPSAYRSDQLQGFQALPNGIEIHFAIGQARDPQVAFYLGRRDSPGRLPERLWVMFGGIDTLALLWVDWLEEAPDPAAGFLLLDYPGYGLCRGEPRARTILESSLAALEALAGHFGVDRQVLEERLGVLGHSFGAATALQFAARLNPRWIILVSPFTSIDDMSFYRYGALLGGWINRIHEERYDNRARLAEVSGREPRPAVTVIHGAEDTLIPAWMGRDLADRHPEWIRYREWAGIGHFGMIEKSLPLIFERMFE